MLLIWMAGVVIAVMACGAMMSFAGSTMTAALVVIV